MVSYGKYYRHRFIIETFRFFSSAIDASSLEELFRIFITYFLPDVMVTREFELILPSSLTVRVEDLTQLSMAIQALSDSVISVHLCLLSWNPRLSVYLVWALPRSSRLYSTVRTPRFVINSTSNNVETPSLSFKCHVVGLLPLARHEHRRHWTTLDVQHPCSRIG